MKPMKRLLATLLLLYAACEAHQELGDRCPRRRPMHGDAGALLDASRVVGEQVDPFGPMVPDGSTRIGIVGRPFDSCLPTEPPPSTADLCSDPRNLEGCVNPFFQLPDGGAARLLPDGTVVREPDDPCACDDMNVAGSDS